MEKPNLMIKDIISFCAVKNCEINLGDPQIGFIKINGSGLERSNNYQRYFSLNELSSFPSPEKVIKEASIFIIHLGQKSKTLDRIQFEQELKTFQQKADI